MHKEIMEEGSRNHYQSHKLREAIHWEAVWDTSPWKCKICLRDRREIIFYLGISKAYFDWHISHTTDVCWINDYNRHSITNENLWHVVKWARFIHICITVNKWVKVFSAIESVTWPTMTMDLALAAPDNVNQVLYMVMDPYPRVHVCVCTHTHAHA